MLLVALSLANCSSKVEIASPEKAKQFFQVAPLPNDSSKNPDKKYPVVFFFQGSGGKNNRAWQWARWFARHGVASVFIDSAGIRGRDKLYGVNYGRDLAPALDAVKDNPRLNLANYAVMGFSRGGTAALESGTYLKSRHSIPDFIFALYPGALNHCPNTYGERVRTYVFYGDLDEWGNYKGTRQSCRKMTDRYANSSFIALKGAHHGYDGGSAGSFKCCGGNTFKYAPNPKALARTKSIILKAIRAEWRVR